MYVIVPLVCLVDSPVKQVHKNPANKRQQDQANWNKEYIL
jgi:hypothetical protein